MCRWHRSSVGPRADKSVAERSLLEEPLCRESPEFRAHQRVAARERQRREQVPDQRMRHQIGEEQRVNPPGGAWFKGSQPRDECLT